MCRPSLNRCTSARAKVLLPEPGTPEMMKMGGALMVGVCDVRKCPASRSFAVGQWVFWPERLNVSHGVGREDLLATVGAFVEMHIFRQISLAAYDSGGIADNETD